MSRKLALALSTALTVFVLIVGLALAARVGITGAPQAGSLATDGTTATAPAARNTSNATTSADQAPRPTAPALATRPARSSEWEREHDVAAYGLKEGRSAEYRGRGGREDDDD